MKLPTIKSQSNHAAFAYLEEIEGFGWDGKQSLIIFDGVCVLCSRFAQWVMKYDAQETFLFATAQSDLGQILFQHYDLDGVEFETNLVIIDGKLYDRLNGFYAVCDQIGYPWRFLTGLRILPDFVNDWFYERIKRNRFAIFGRHEQCIYPNEALKKRFIK